jgi:hypothetical protein
MIGMFVIHPKTPHDAARATKTMAIDACRSWALLPNNDVPNTLCDGIQLADAERQSGASDHAAHCEEGRARAHCGMVNLGMDHHPDSPARSCSFM